MSLEVAYQGKFLSIKKNGSWEYAERIGCHSAVVIVPITEDNEIVLVEQMRLPLGRNVIEFPAGLIGDEGPEGFLTAAVRELYEETGFVPVDEDDFDYFGEFCTSPGLTNEKVHMVRMRVEREFGATPEEGIKVHVIPVDKLEFWLKEKGKECDISVKVFLYALKFEDCDCTSVDSEHCDCPKDNLAKRVIRHFLNNMVQWTIAVCLSASIGSCTLREIVTAWK